MDTGALTCDIHLDEDETVPRRSWTTPGIWVTSPRGSSTPGTVTGTVLDDPCLKVRAGIPRDVVKLSSPWLKP
jgi:hypothetical protein